MISVQSMLVLKCMLLSFWGADYTLVLASKLLGTCLHDLHSHKTKILLFLPSCTSLSYLISPSIDTAIFSSFEVLALSVVWSAEPFALTRSLLQQEPFQILSLFHVLTFNCYHYILSPYKNTFFEDSFTLPKQHTIKHIPAWTCKFSFLKLGTKILKKVAILIQDSRGN